MSLFDSASLVVTPNGTKASKLYAIKPTDGSGDLVVTRATTATRVNSDGLIEQVPYNLLQRSEEFNNAIWGKKSVTITANSVIAPNNTLTADTFTTSSVNATIDQNVTFQNPCTFSIYVKYIDSQFIQLYAGISSQSRANFDILNGVVGDRGTDTSNSTIESVGNGWYKLTVTFINNSGVEKIRVKFVASLTSGWGVASTNAINSAYLWGAQLVTGTSAKEYFPTTDRLNVPRLDYTNSSCPSILVEPQRTNLALYSEDLNNANWNKVNSITVDSNASVAPDGNTTADRLNAIITASVLRQFVNVTAGQTVTFSCYIKKSIGSPTTKIRIEDQLIPYGNNNIDVVATNTWQKISVTRTVGLGVTQVSIDIFPDINSNGSVFIWGAQLEAGAYPTSYIPTVASSVTRNADVISKTGISSLIGQTNGVVFLEIGEVKNNGATGAEVWYFEMRKDQNNSFGLASAGGTPQPIRFVTKIAGAVTTESEAAPFGNSKIAIKYTDTQFKFFINGTLLYTVSKSIGGYADIEFMESASVNLLMILKKFLIFPSALSDADCISLTT